METKLLEYFKQFVVKRIFAWGKSSSNAQNKIQEFALVKDQVKKLLYEQNLKDSKFLFGVK